jgi:hypothetical protein
MKRIKLNELELKHLKEHDIRLIKRFVEFAIETKDNGKKVVIVKTKTNVWYPSYLDMFQLLSFIMLADTYNIGEVDEIGVKHLQEFLKLLNVKKSGKDNRLR